MRKMFQKWLIVKGWGDFFIAPGFFRPLLSQDVREAFTLPS